MSEFKKIIEELDNLVMPKDLEPESIENAFKKKLSDEGCKGNYTNNFGLSDDKIEELKRQVDTDLMPVIRAGEDFDLDKVLKRFNQILSDKRYL